MEENKELLEILQRTIPIFFKYGVRSITMDDISHQLGISKKTLYNHIENKADLIEKIMLKHLEDEKSHCDHITQTDLNAIDQLVQIFQFNLNYIKDISHTTIFELKKYYGSTWQRFEDHKHTYIRKSVYNNIKLGQEQGLFRTNLNADIISRIYTNRIDMIIDGNVFPMSEFSFKDVIKELLMYHLHGIVSQKGLEYIESLNFNF